MITSRSLQGVLATTIGGRARTVGRVVTPVGWMLIVGGVTLLVVGHLLGWTELTVLAVTLLVVVGLSAPFAFGQTDLQVELEIKPSSVTVGQRSAAQVTVRGNSDRTVRNVRMELRVGDSFAEFSVPVLRQGGEYEEPFVLPTVRRGVIMVGPTLSVRSDPLGILRRTQIWTDEYPLIVHPKLVKLAELGTGFITDLEGIATNNRSDSDVAFHTLRAYEPGDDPRHIHWLSTARTGTLVVRQFIDTRRSHIGIALDSDPKAYGTEDEFELAISVAGSIGTRVFLDEQQVTAVFGSDRLQSIHRTAFLDTLAGVEADPRSPMLKGAIASLVRASSGLSLAVVITGRNTPLDRLRLRLSDGLPATGVPVPPVVAVAGRSSPPVLVVGRMTTIAPPAPPGPPPPFFDPAGDRPPVSGGSTFDLGTESASGRDPVPVWVVAFLLVYACVYSGAMLSLSWVKFRKQAI